MKLFSNMKVATDAYTVLGDIDKICSELIFTEDGFYSASTETEIKTVIEKHPSGVYKRRDTIKNISGRDITLRMAQSKFTLPGGEYEVYTQHSEWCNESVGQWIPLVSEVSAETEDIRSGSSSVPFMALLNEQNGRGIAFHLIHNCAWSMKISRRYFQTGGKKTVAVEMGICPRNFSYILKNEETLELPEILYYEFTNKNDIDAYKLHRYCNSTLEKNSLPIAYNTWMSDFDRIGYDKLMPQLEKAAFIGAEYFVIDAGWFGAPNKWHSLVGDWEECLTGSMQGRMKDFADAVREKGLKFGLWLEIERAAAGSNAVGSHPEFYFREGEHYFVNFADPKATDHIFSVTANLIRKYGIEYIKFDFNAPITFDKNAHAFLEYFEGYKRFLQQIKNEFPSIHLLCCASGGLRMTLGTLLSGFDSFWVSDNHSMFRQLEIYKDTVKRMPSKILEKWATLRSLENFRPVYCGDKTEMILSSADAGWGRLEGFSRDFLSSAMLGGAFSISCDLTKLSDGLLSFIRDEISAYKRERNFWENSECHILTDTESILVLQFTTESLSKIKLAVYTKTANQNSVTVYPVCSPSKIYEINGTQISGEELSENGYEIPLNGHDRFDALKVEFNQINA